jgi:S-adenosylmethionine synthetase
MSDRNIRVEQAPGQAVEDQAVEIVERKGLGHPDSICDGVAEHVSRALAKAYIDTVGKVLHFNTDETQLVAGDSAPAYGGGAVVDPMYLLVVGRATKRFVAADGTEYIIPAESIALEAAREYLRERFEHLDLETDVIVDVKLGEGSGDLVTVFGEEGGQIPKANDTSFGVGHAPLSETEQIVINTELRLHDELEERWVGTDIKVMGKRETDRITVTVAVAMVDAYLPDQAAYERAVATVREFVTTMAAEYTDRSVDVFVNTADDYERGAVYLTTTGTSAEQGDDGSVGRGNRANGLITPNRSMSMEASSGKNPVNHIGKIYNLLSTRIARAIWAEVEGVREVRIRLLSQIGHPIDEPHVADASVITEEGVALATIAPSIEAIVDRELADVTSVTRDVINGELRTF